MYETYNSDSSDGSIIIPSSSAIPESPPAGDPALESYKSLQFVIVDHTANIRNGSEVSRIWKHGFERRRVDDGTFDWRCGHCQHKKILKCAQREEVGRPVALFATYEILPNAEINLSPRGQRGRGQVVGSPRLSNLEH
jgi:hypothetical protein